MSTFVSRITGWVRNGVRSVEGLVRRSPLGSVAAVAFVLLMLLRA